MNTILARFVRIVRQWKPKVRGFSWSAFEFPNFAFGRPIAIGTSILRGRCPYSQQHECQLFMGQYTSTEAVNFSRLRKFKIGNLWILRWDLVGILPEAVASGPQVYGSTVTFAEQVDVFPAPLSTRTVSV
jgi:hypothetical protein